MANDYHYHTKTYEGYDTLGKAAYFYKDGVKYRLWIYKRRKNCPDAFEITHDQIIAVIKKFMETPHVLSTEEVKEAILNA